jgi:hypothetical protein
MNKTLGNPPSEFNFLPRMDELEQITTPSSFQLNGARSTDHRNDSRVSRVATHAQ